MSQSKYQRRAFIKSVSAVAGSVYLSGCGSSSGVADAGAGDVVTSSGEEADTMQALALRTTSTTTSSASTSTSSTAATSTSALNPVNALRFTSDRSGLLPVMAATVLRKGAYPSSVAPVASSSSVHVVVKRRWNDGSAKHVILSGLLDLTNGTPKDVSLQAGSSSGTPLTSAAIAAARPNATVKLGSLATVSLASLLASPVRTWVATPNMVECHYLAKPVANMYVWFHVRYWTGGHVWVRVVVEYSKLPYTSNTSLTYIPSVTLGSTVVWNNAGANYTHALETRWSVEGWVSGGAGITVRHDPLALRDTKMVPNFFARNPSDSALAALKTSYTPGSLVDLRTAYEGTGYSMQIGLLPVWDVHYLTTGDPRAWRAVQANSLAAGTHATIWRDPNTNRAIRPSDWPSWSYSGNNGGGHTTISAINQSGAKLTWDTAHNASSGYTAYMLTGDYIHLETMHMQCSSIYLACSSQGGLGTKRIVYGQTRAVGWFFRSVGQLAAIAPSDDVVASDMAAWLNGNVAFHKANGPDANPAGIGYPITIGTYSTTKPLSVAPWMHQFWIQSMGHVSDLEPHADMSAFNTLRNWMYRGVVGMLGSGAVGSYDFRYAGLYNVTVGAQILPDGSKVLAANLLQSWGAVWAATQPYIATLAATGGTKFPLPAIASPNTLYPSSGSGSWSYFENLLPSIAQAVDHGIAGAQEAWNRLTGASNWNTVKNDVLNYPMWAVEPRGAISAPAPAAPPPASGGTDMGSVASPQKLDKSAMPAWRQAMSPRTWAAIPAANTLAAIDPAKNINYNTRVPSAAIWQGTDGQRAVLDAWGGAVLDPATDTFIVWGGGHGNYAGNEAYKIRLDQSTPAWSMVGTPSGSGQAASVTSSILQSTTAPATAGTYFDGRPRSQHTYDKMVWVPGLGVVLGNNVGGYATGQLGDKKAWTLNINSGSWSELAAAGPSESGVVSFCHDPKRNYIWRFRALEQTVMRCDLNASAKSWVSVSTTGATAMGDPWYVSSEYIDTHDLIVILRGRYIDTMPNSLRLFDPVTSTHYAPTIQGTPPVTIKNWGYAAPSWVPSLNAVCFWDNEAGQEAGIAMLRPTGNPRTSPWEWVVLAPAAGSTVKPTARAENGTYGRFVYSPRLDGFYLLNDVKEPVYFFALS